jgi:hypothetical protein
MCDVQINRILLRGGDVLRACDRCSSPETSEFHGDFLCKPPAWLVSYRLDRMLRVGMQRQFAPGCHTPAGTLSLSLRVCFLLGFHGAGLWSV